MLISDKSGMKEQAKVTYSPISKAFEMQRKTIEYVAENKEKQLKIKNKQRLYKL